MVRPFRAFKEQYLRDNNLDPADWVGHEEKIKNAWLNKKLAIWKSDPYHPEARLWGIEEMTDVPEFHVTTGTVVKRKLMAKWQFFEDTDLDKDPEVYTRDTAILEQKVTGRFFRGHGEDTVYYGQTALCWAVARRQMDMMDLLIEWGATLRTDDMYSNSIFHHCALYGTPKIWDKLVVAKIVEDRRTEHDEKEDADPDKSPEERKSFSAQAVVDQLEFEDNPDDEEDTNEDEEMRYQAEAEIRKLFNRAGMNPLQFAAFCNNKRVFKKIIITANKIKLWQWGDKANFSYMLGGIDSFHKMDGKAEDYHGIDVLTIINCEGLYEFMDFPIIRQLVKKKFDSWGYFYLNGCLLIQFVYCIILSIETHALAPNFQDEDNTDAWGYEGLISGLDKFLIFWVVVKCSCEFLIQVLEWFPLVRVYKFQRGTQIFFESSFAAGGCLNRVIQGIRKCSIRPAQTTLKFLDMMIKRSARTQDFPNKVFKSREEAQAHMKAEKEEDNRELLDDHDEADDENEEPANSDYVSVTGLFQKIRFFASLSSALALLQASAYDGKNAHDSLNAKIFCLNLLLLLICEWLLLFMYTQHFPGIARFIASLVTMVANDITGFVVVYGIILIGFASVFVVLSNGEWGNLIYAVLEITKGTGEFYFDDDAVFNPGNGIGFAKWITYGFYALYMITMILVMLNLLIAVMSETAMSILSDTFENRKRLMGCSAVLMMERRVTVVQYWLGECLYCFSGCCGKKWSFLPQKSKYKYRHPLLRGLYKRTGQPGAALLDMLSFQSEDLQEELKRSYTVSVIEDVTIAKASAHQYANLSIDEIMKLDEEGTQRDGAGRAPRLFSSPNLLDDSPDGGSPPVVKRQGSASSPRGPRVPGHSPRGKLQRQGSFDAKKKKRVSGLFGKKSESKRSLFGKKRGSEQPTGAS